MIRPSTIAAATETAMSLNMRGLALPTNAAMLVVGFITVNTPAICPDTRTGAATNKAAGASGLFGSREVRAVLAFERAFHIAPHRKVLADGLAAVRIEQHNAPGVRDVDAEVHRILAHFVDLRSDLATAHVFEHLIELVGGENPAFGLLADESGQDVRGVHQRFLRALQVGHAHPGADLFQRV